VLPQSRLRNQVGACLCDIRQWSAPHFLDFVPPVILSPAFLLLEASMFYSRPTPEPIGALRAR